MSDINDKLRQWGLVLQNSLPAFSMIPSKSKARLRVRPPLSMDSIISPPVPRISLSRGRRSAIIMALKLSANKMKNKKLTKMLETAK